VARAFLKKKRIDEVTAWDVERFKAARVENVTKSTVNRDLAVLKRLFSLAVDWGLLDKNPLKKIALYRIEETLMRVVTEEEERSLIEAAAPHFKPVIVVAINTGMRRGELLSLRWDEVDLHSGTITVKQSKSGRVRHVPLNKTAQEALASVPEPHEGCVFRYRGSKINDVKTAFLKAVKRAGIPPCRFHDLRHSFATRLVLAGVDLATVKELMGHASISTTMRYAHPSPPHKREAVARLDSTRVARIPLEIPCLSD
jgi:integrase